MTRHQREQQQLASITARLFAPTPTRLQLQAMHERMTHAGEVEYLASKNNNNNNAIGGITK